MNPTLLITVADAALRDLYQRFLSEFGYEVETASDGLDCVEKLRRLMPSVLVLDRELRWGGGDGVLAWLRERGSPFGVRVVLTTTDRFPPDPAEVLRPPVVKLLSRPFSLMALLETVRAAVACRGREESFERNCAPACSERYIG
jgi:DNA-binding response OmpR family regulator